MNFYICFLFCWKVSLNSNFFSNVLLKVLSKIKMDLCKLIYYFSVELKFIILNLFLSSSILKYNDFDINVILVDR